MVKTRLMYLAMDFLTTLILESLEAAPPVTWKPCLMREKIKIGINDSGQSQSDQEKIRV